MLDDTPPEPMADGFDVARASLRATLATTAPSPELERDARLRSEVVARLAKLRGPQLAAFVDSARALAPDEELDRLLKRSA